MLLFGHAGITVGLAALVARGVSQRRDEPSDRASGFASLTHHVDVRLLVIGSLLPDIIDKPIGQYFFRDTFSNGRIFAHTLLFLILITTAGYYLYRRYKQFWLLTLAAGTFTHLAFDEMWQVPGTLFWPLMGFHFAKYDLMVWMTNIFQGLLSSPYIYVSEAIGLVIIIWFGVWLISQKRVGTFLRHGKIS